jgi:hypothetical protein
MTAMKVINIQTGNINPAVNWISVNQITDCGQKTKIINNSSIAGEVDLYY